MATHEDMAAYFDRWYADMRDAPAKDLIQQRHLGLPPELLSASLLTWDGVADVTEALALAPGHVLVDLACGRGGYGLEIAARTGATLVGIDFAPTAVEAARGLASRRGAAADFRVGDLAATGLPDGAADAVMVVDAIQFPEDPAAAYREIARILRPGGRAVLTAWEPVDRDASDEGSRIDGVDLHGGLTGAGLTDVVVTERGDWLEIERGMWAEASAIDPDDDPAMTSFRDEGVRVLPALDGVRRVMASATRPVCGRNPGPERPFRRIGGTPSAP